MSKIVASEIFTATYLTTAIAYELNIVRVENDPQRADRGTSYYAYVDGKEYWVGYDYIDTAARAKALLNDRVREMHLLPICEQQLQYRGAGYGWALRYVESAGAPECGNYVGVHAMGKIRPGIVIKVTKTRCEVAYTTPSSAGRVYVKNVRHADLYY